MTHDPTENCATCRYSTGKVVADPKTNDEVPWRLCRRRPPTVMTQPWAWPELRIDDWCGEWERSSQPIPDARPLDERT